MKAKSIIFFDIDGTLLNGEKQLPASTKESVFQLKAAGHEVAIATGRGPFMFEDLRKELDIHTFVSYNGQYVVLQDEVIYTNPLNEAALGKLTETALEKQHPVVFMDEKDMKANVPKHAYIKEGFDSLKVGFYPTFDPVYYQGRELYQALLFCPEEDQKPYENAFSEFDFIRWHPVSLDVIPHGGSKAKGIEKVIEKLGMPKERQFAFGDGLNDMEMLREIPNSVAMGNAVQKVKDAAAHVTTSVEDDGIYHGLVKLGLLS